MTVRHATTRTVSWLARFTRDTPHRRHQGPLSLRDGGSDGTLHTLRLRGPGWGGWDALEPASMLGVRMQRQGLRSRDVPSNEFTLAPLAPHFDSGTVWAHATRTFQTLGYRFAVRSTHEGIGRYIDDMYAPSAVPGDPSVWYSILDGVPGRWSHALFRDDECLTESDRGAYVLNYLTWHVNQQVVATSDDYVLLHAAAAARDGLGILLPAAMEAGKTTLVAGLVRAGFSYLTDEAAAIHPETLLVEPFPKPLSIDQGSWSVLADFEPRVDDSTMAYLSEQWHVPPRVVRDDAISGPASVGLIVFPSYVAGPETKLEPMVRAEALLAMLKQTFRFHENGRRNLEVLGRLLDGLPCFRLVSGDLDNAVAGIGTLIDQAIETSAAGGWVR